MSKVTTITATLLILSALAGGMIALADAAKDPPTELYVRTVPAGATVSVDGKRVGTSDNLFEVQPGPRKIDVALDGFEPGHKEVTVPSAQIKRVMFELKKQANPSADNILSNPGAEAGDKTPDAWVQGAAIPGVTYSWDKKVTFEGKASLCIEKTAQRYFPIATWSQTIERKGDAPSLELSAQVKAEKMCKAILDVVFLDKNGKWISHKWAAYIGIKKQGQPPANHDWKKYSGTVDIPPGTAQMVVGLQVYGPGKVWFDDVRLGKVKEKAEINYQATNENVQRRAVGKKVADFPEAVDLSTPEAAWAAYHRASGHQDAKGVVDLSWVKIDPAQMELSWTNAEPKDMSVYNKAQLNAKCVEILTYRGELAVVLSRLEFPPGKGRHPYSLRFFGLINGKWKNLGEGRYPSSEAAKNNFQRKKKRSWESFKRIKASVDANDKSERSTSPRILKSAKNPHPVKTIPKIGATDVDPDLKEIRVTFDRDMDKGGFSWCGGGPYYPKATSKPKWINRRTCILPVKLEKGKAYRLALNWGRFQNFRSAQGEPATPTALYFCTRGASPKLVAMVTPPKVVKLSIANGAKDVPPGRTKLSVTFDQEMGGGMSWCNGPDTPKLEPVNGSAWSTDKKTCSIYTLLEPERDYTVYLNGKRFGNFMNELGVSLKPVTWKFTTSAAKTE